MGETALVLLNQTQAGNAGQFFDAGQMPGVSSDDVALGDFAEDGYLDLILADMFLPLTTVPRE